ncbi:MAG: 2,3-bisphosphoglycerate-independent phosphoglycerate mutase [Bacilli bacterium]|nr:2,3-bisphosphoglycerate-independent phosphoglycerate mutase [Bacilli bacterium]
MNMNKVMLIILDGVGYREEEYGNAFKQANTPNLDYLYNEYPHCLIDASERHVGLPDGQMGNSEVGHMNIGAGRIVFQQLQLINESISNGSFYNNKKIIDVINHSKNNDSKLHIMGLISDGGVHSHIEHFKALLKMAKDNNVNKLYFHLITDGRDTLPDSAYKYIEEIEKELNGFGRIATISGRYYAMDRDNNFDRVKKYYDAVINNVGEHYNSSKELIDNNYNKKIFDEFINPGILDSNGIIEENDGIIWANYRPDRAWEILSSITNNEFEKFEKKKFNNIKLVTMMPVADSVINEYAFKLDKLDNTFGEYIARFGLKQLRIAETEKYAHVTYFFDGGIEKQIPNCDRVLINSPKVATYDLKPEMSSYEITRKLLEIMDKYDVIILNFANGDMVGHTGVIEAAIKAMEAIDYNMGLIYEKAKQLGFTLLVTADHGNCEEMLDANGTVLTAHSLNKVPLIITDKKYSLVNGKLGDLAPTMLKILNIEKTKEMKGDSLINIE